MNFEDFYLGFFLGLYGERFGGLGVTTGFDRFAYRVLYFFRDAKTDVEQANGVGYFGVGTSF